MMLSKTSFKDLLECDTFCLILFHSFYFAAKKPQSEMPNERQTRINIERKKWLVCKTREKQKLETRRTSVTCFSASDYGLLFPFGVKMASVEASGGSSETK